MHVGTPICSGVREGTHDGLIVRLRQLSVTVLVRGQVHLLVRSPVLNQANMYALVSSEPVVTTTGSDVIREVASADVAVRDWLCLSPCLRKS